MKQGKRERKKIDTREQKDSFLYWLAFVGLWGLIFLPPYFRGLFFNTEQNTALIFALIVFSLWWFVKVKDEGVDILNNPLDWFVLGLLLSYIIAYFGAVNQKLAIVEIIKYMLYFNVFWLASRLVIDYKSSVSLLNVIILSAVGVALAGIFSAMDWISIKDGFVDNRIYSTLQYPNTLASYLLAVSILALGLWQNSKKHYKYGYIVLTYIMMVVFFGTNSRGAFLLLPIMLVLTLANPWLKYRIEAFFFWVFVLLGSLIANNGLIPNIVEDKIGLAWLWFFIGLAVVIVAQLGLNIIREKGIIKSELPQGKILLVVMIVLIAISFLGWQYVLPEDITNRLATISLDDSSLGSRVYWPLEAFKMVKESPIFGLGGGAWEASYHHFQGYYYQSTQVHNDFAQTLMQVGYVGLTFFVGLWFAMLYMGFRLLKVVDDNLKNIQWALMVGVISLGAHAFIDFDFSLSAVTIVLFVLFGITAGIYSQQYPNKTWFKGATVPVVVLSAVFIILQLVLPITLAIASSNASKGLEAYRSGNMEATINYFEKARTYDPFAASYRIDLANFYLSQGEEVKAEEYLLAAVERDKYNSEVYKKASQIYFNLDNIDKAVEYMELSRDSNRWHQETWNDLAQMYYYGAIMSMESGDYDLAEAYLNKASTIPDQISAKMGSLGEWENSLWRSNRLRASADIYLYAGIGNYFTDNLKIAEEYFNVAVKSNNEALWWLALLKERQGQNQEMAELYERAQAEHPEFENNFHAISNMQEAWWNR
ncbi:MAG: hypothetical protein APF76_16060 [Desulfitibacter sp. BRH_c19]|nr:MAG: hypothetical protein APF76_16060 [Desulfitibacter sp. BRH_c19]